MNDGLAKMMIMHSPARCRRKRPAGTGKPETGAAARAAFLLFALASLVLSAASLQAAEMTPLEAARRLQASYEQTTSLKADFVQDTYSRMSRRKKSGSGTVVLAKPGLMRWDYLQPDRQVMVCDGKTISMYFARERQMVVTEASQYLESDVMYSFFAGNGDIVRDFDIFPPDDDERDPMPGSVQIKAIPKNGHNQVDVIDLWVDTVTGLLTRIAVTDKFGSVTDIRFANIRRNEKVDKAIFTYTPPEGTEIVKQ